MASNLLLVGAGGFIGSSLRYLVGWLVAPHSPGGFPFSTLVVNAVGCFLMGLLVSVAERQSILSPSVFLFLGTGVLGGFTTFSAFSVESIALIRGQLPAMALLNVSGNLLLGLMGCAFGMKVGGSFS